MPGRTVEEAELSSRNYTKTCKPTLEEEANAALETGDLKAMLKDHRNILATMNAYVCELMDIKVEEKDPRKLLNLLLASK